MLTTWLSNAAGEIDLSETGIAAPGRIRPFIGGRLSNTLPRFGPNVGSPPHSRRSAKRCRRSQFDPTRTNNGFQSYASAGPCSHLSRVSTAPESRPCPGDFRSTQDSERYRSPERVLWRPLRHCVNGGFNWVSRRSEHTVREQEARPLIPIQAL